jgi:hypothetical protein
MKWNARRFSRLTTLALFCGLISAGAVPLYGDDPTEEHALRVQIFDTQQQIVQNVMLPAVDRIRALRVVVAVATGEYGKNTRNLPNEAVVLLSQLAGDPDIGSEVLSGLGAIVVRPAAPLDDPGYLGAVAVLRQSAASSAGGFYQQAGAMRMLSEALVNMNIAKAAFTAAEPRYAALVQAHGDIAVSTAADRTVRLAAVNSLALKGNQYVQKVNALTSAMVALAAAPAASQPAAQTAVKAAQDALPPQLAMRMIVREIGVVAATQNLPPLVGELASRALVDFLAAKETPATTPPAVATAPPAGGSPPAGGDSSPVASKPQPDLSGQPLAAGDLPTAAGSMLTAASRLGVSATRPFDSAKDAYTPKRKTTDVLPSTSDAARRARATGGTRATGAFGIRYIPATVTTQPAGG